MELKLCPTCKTSVFEDMDICYGCMYRFGSDPAREEAVKREIEGSDFPEDVLEGEGCGNAGWASDDSQIWPPPIERQRDAGQDTAVVSGRLAAAGAPMASTRVVVVGAWRVSLREQEVVSGGSGLEITVEPASAATCAARTAPDQDAQQGRSRTVAI